jgi:hypothetical protein
MHCSVSVFTFLIHLFVSNLFIALFRFYFSPHFPLKIFCTHSAQLYFLRGSKHKTAICMIKVRNGAASVILTFLSYALCQNMNTVLSTVAL